MLNTVCNTLQAQLRGQIGDYQDSDEGALAKGLEAFDTINRVLEDRETLSSPTEVTEQLMVSPEAPGSELAPPPQPPVSAALPQRTAPQADLLTPGAVDRPLMDF